MKTDLLGDVTRKTRFYDPGEYHENSTGTEDRDIDWSGVKIWRWSPISEEVDRTRNLPSIVNSLFVTRGAHDVVTLLLSADLLKEEIFSLHKGELNPWWKQVVHQGLIEGPSPLGTGSENFTVYDVEDPALDEEFLKSFGPSLAQISRLTDLREGWDSYGGRKIESEARQAAGQFLKILYGLGGPIPRPIVGPSPNGAVVLQWFLPRYEIFAELGPDTCEYYVALRDQDDVIQEGSIDSVEELVRRLLPFLR